MNTAGDTIEVEIWQTGHNTGPQEDREGLTDGSLVIGVGNSATQEFRYVIRAQAKVFSEKFEDSSIRPVEL